MNLKNIKVTNLRAAVLLLSLAGIATGLGIGFGIANSSATDLSTYTEKKTLTTEVVSNLTKSYLVNKADVKNGDVYLVSKRTNELELTPQTNNVLIPKTNLNSNTVYSVGGTPNAPTLTPVLDYIMTANSALVKNNQLYYITASNEFLNVNQVTAATIGHVYINVGTAVSPNVVKATYDSEGVATFPAGTVVSLDAKVGAFNTEIVDRTGTERTTYNSSATASYSILEMLNAYQPEHSWMKFTEDDLTTILANRSKYKFRLWAGDRRSGGLLDGRIGIVGNWNGSDVENLTLEPDFASIGEPDLDYQFSFTFNKDNSKAITITGTHSNQDNTYGGIRGLQVYIETT